MAITVTESSGGGFTDGWHDATIAKVESGDYNGSKYLDVRFEEYPETLKLRLWETKNKQGEEFVISNMIRYSNPDVLEEGTNEDGKKTASLDDSSSSLIGKKLQVLFYKNANGYTEVSQKVAPHAPFENAIDNFSVERIEGIKQAGERYQTTRNQANGVASTSTTGDTGDTAGMPW